MSSGVLKILGESLCIQHCSESWVHLSLNVKNSYFCFDFFFAIFVVQRLLRRIKSKFSLQFESLESDLGAKNAFFVVSDIKLGCVTK